MGRTSNGKRPGVRGLARTTGLSVATISRVLNNSAQVNRETRERVLTAMRQAGYTPDPAARALATRRTRTIGAVVPTLAHSIFARFLDAVEQELAARSYALVIATTEGEPEVEERRARELINMGAEGIILSGADHDEVLLDLLDTRGIPAACTSVSATENGLPAIGYDNAAIGEKAVAYLAARGHRRVLVIHGPRSNNDRTRLRIQGVEAGAAKAGIGIDLIETTLDVAGGVASANALTARGAWPSAILCLSDVQALGMLFEANRRQIAIPGQLSLMGFDDLDWAAYSAPPLTTIRLPTARMGHRVAAALVDYLDDAAPIETVALDAAIVERGSVGRPR